MPAGSFNKILVFIFLSAVCLCLYHNCLNNAFLYDGKIIMNHVYVENIRLSPRLFTSQMSAASRYYRPLAVFAHSLCYFFFRQDPIGHHFVNIMLYALNAFLIYLFIGRIFHDEILALICAFIFAVHPVHSQEVAIVDNMAYILEGIFVISCIMLFLSYCQKRLVRDYLLSLIFFIFALLCRESALFAPLMIVLSFLFASSDRKTAFAAVVPFFLFGAVYLLLRQAFVPVEYLALDSRGAILRLPAFFYYCHEYVRQIILMPYRFVEGSTARKLVGILSNWGAFLLYAAIARLLWLKNKVIIFGCIFFIVACCPLLRLSQKIAMYGVIVFDHYAYLGSLGLILILAFFLRRLSSLSFCFAVLIFSLAMVFYGILTIRAIPNYKNEETYYRYMLSLESDCAFAHAGLASVYFNKGMLREAQGESEMALKGKNRKQISRVYTTLGSIWCSRGALDKGTGYYKLAIQLEPEYNIPYINLAMADYQHGYFEDAESNFRRGIDMDKTSLFALENFSQFLFVRGRYAEAARVCARIMALKPDDTCAKDILAKISAIVGTQ